MMILSLVLQHSKVDVQHTATIVTTVLWRTEDKVCSPLKYLFAVFMDACSALTACGCFQKYFYTRLQLIGCYISDEPNLENDFNGIGSCVRS